MGKMKNHNKFIALQTIQMNNQMAAMLKKRKILQKKECPTSIDTLTMYTTTSSGQVSKPPACLIEEIGEAALSAAE